MAKVISKLTVLVGATTGPLNRDLRQGAKAVGQFGQRVESNLRASAAALTTFVAGAAAAALSTRSLVDQFAQIDKLAKTADKLGETTEALAGFQFAAEQTGVAGDTAAVGLQRMVRRISAAAQGTGEARKALLELGLSAERLAQMTPTEAFKEIADAMNRVQSAGDRVRLTFALFDTEGVNLVNTMRLGSDGLAAMQAEAERLGITISRTAAADVEAANDAIHKMGLAAQGLTRTLAVQLAPAVVAAADAITAAVVQLGQLDAQTVANIAKVAAFGAAFIALLKIVPLVIGAVRAVILTYRALTTASIISQAVANPLNLLKIGASLAGAAVLAYAAGRQFDAYADAAKKAAANTERLGKAAQPIKTFAKEAEAAKESAEAARQELERWQGIGERLTERFRTPFEVLRDSVGEAREALARGVISWDTYGRAVAAAVDEWERAGEAVERFSRGGTQVAALSRGSAGASAALARGRDQLAQLQEQIRRQTERDEARRKVLEDINQGVADTAQAVRDAGRIEVTEVRI